jgi:high-affinity iron transporter
VSQAALIAFREGLESFLIVGVILAYLRKTGRQSLVRGVHIGLAVSVVTCTTGAYFWYRWLQSETGGPNQAKYEAIGALAAAVFVGALLWQTVRAGKRLKGQIEAKLERATADRASWQAVAGVALVTTLLVTREGLEAVLFLGVQVFAAQAAVMAVGALLGLAAAGLIALVWSRFSHRLQIGLVLRVTSIFLALFLIQLLVYGVHELAESGMIQGSQAFHDATERFGPDGDIGQWLAISLAGAPILYLLLDRLRRRRAPAQQPAPAPSPSASPSQPGRDARVTG